jgi:hypothetical protein
MLEVYPFTAPRIKLLQDQIATHVESMTFEHHGKLLEQCGLAPVMRAIHSRQPDVRTIPFSLTSHITDNPRHRSRAFPALRPRTSLAR